MKYEKDSYRLASGRRLWANRGILGIRPDLGITEGFDGDVVAQSCEPEGDFAAEEKREIADHMAALWQEWGGTKNSSWSEEAPNPVQAAEQVLGFLVYKPPGYWRTKPCQCGQAFADCRFEPQSVPCNRCGKMSESHFVPIVA